MGNIIKQFTYAIPNEYFGVDDSNGTVVNATYNGPDYIWVFVNDETKKLDGIAPMTVENGGEEYPAPPGYTKVKVDASADTKLAGILMPELVTVNDEKNLVVENLPDSQTHEYEYPLDIDVAYNRHEITFESNTWNTPYHESVVTWDDIISERNALLESSDTRVATDMPDSVKQPWIDYRQKLRDLPTTWNGIDAHKVQFPESPDDIKG